MADPAGYLALVLHAHLPHVRHPEHRYHLEENWLYEAIAATYLPLVELLQGLARATIHDGPHARLTMSMSPPLVSMLRDDLLKQRAAAYLDRLVILGDKEQARLRGASLAPVAAFYAERFTRLRDLWRAVAGDLPGAFRRLMDDGVVELITVGGTHGYQPTIREPAARRAQIRVAAAHYREHFGRDPLGIWLPECGYTDGVEELLADEGIRWFLTDAHGLLHARPRPPFGTFAPVYTRAGVAAFARDLESSKQVWSAAEGYPGDEAYRDFYRDIGFDLPLDYIGPFVHPDGIRVHTGFKYHRVTGDVDLAEKAPYEPARARERAATHAGNFLHNRQAQVRFLRAHMDRPPIVVAPYDAELYGHWWFEGPQFLDFLLRKTAFDQEEVQLATPSGYLAAHPVNALAEVAPSSWGDGGYSAVWLDPSNDWIYRHQHRCEARMVELARAHAGGASALTRRALDQAARELLLLESSDWAFILKTGTTTGYATARAHTHVARFTRLDREITTGTIDEGWLAGLESRDNIFPGVSYRIYL